MCCCLACRYPDINVTAGTAVRFVWHNIAHGVNGITSRICPQNFTSDPTIVQLAPVTNGGDYTTPPLSPGDHFYACPVRTPPLCIAHQSSGSQMGAWRLSCRLVLTAHALSRAVTCQVQRHQQLSKCDGRCCRMACRMYRIVQPRCMAVQSCFIITLSLWMLSTKCAGLANGTPLAASFL